MLRYGTVQKSFRNFFIELSRVGHDTCSSFNFIDTFFCLTNIFNRFAYLTGGFVLIRSLKKIPFATLMNAKFTLLRRIL